MNQRQFIHDFNKKTRPPFNPVLFNRTDEDIIDAIRKIVYSLERDSTFVIKVVNFEVITNFDEVNRILWENEDYILNKGKKSESKTTTSKKKTYSKKSKLNPYDFINLNDSELNIIKVDYFIQINEKKDGLVSDTITTYIAVPRIVDGFYFKINGNYYSAMYQIVDASTYNNSASKNSKKQSVTFKTVFTPIRVYRYSTTLQDIDGNEIPCIYFMVNVFKKTILTMKYILARFGFYDTIEFLKLTDINIVNSLYNIDRENFYVFPVREYYIIVPKMLYDASQIAQSFVYTIQNTIVYMKNSSFGEFFTTEFYVKSLGANFVTKNLDTIYSKGLSILDSLEFNYDEISKEDLKLDWEDKSDIYRVLRWILYEFNALRQKDNLNITTKKVRYAPYIASLYADKVAYGIYRISDEGDLARLSTIVKAIKTPPLYLVNAMINCELINYKNCVNDLDAITALKYTFKGIAGIGEKSNAISDAYRSIHPSHLGKVDVDSSSNSDPGVSGTICPYAQMYDWHFSEYQEPSTWNETISSLLDSYRKSVAKIEMCRLIEDNGLSKRKKDTTVVSATANTIRQMCHIVQKDYDEQYINGFDIFGDGLMFYLEE